jgi:alkanesulfonate monooxygenase SsuD/methylene tetrahydromethanopterin reductase-like flavin-dependent oxidoreductase (luciferase family)
MQFGMQFFPDVRPSEKSATQYFDESLRLVDWCDVYGYSHARTVEHYFFHWGGYCPNPVVFLTAASQRSRRARLVTGAVLPVFNHPLKLAGELAMLDAISNGRLDAGFARAFLPYEFRHFGVSMDESVARFEEGMAQVRALLEGENVSSAGKFHRYENVTSLPRPTQQPRPPFWVAAVGTPDSFARAGRLGYYLMAIPGVGASPTELVQVYREAWKQAGHPGKPQVMLAVFMYCHEDRAEAVRIAKPRIERHFQSIPLPVERDARAARRGEGGGRRQARALHRPEERRAGRALAGCGRAGDRRRLRHAPRALERLAAVRGDRGQRRKPHRRCAPRLVGARRVHDPGVELDRAPRRGRALAPARRERPASARAAGAVSRGARVRKSR